jgi:acetylglutamate kinase
MALERSWKHMVGGMHGILKLRRSCSETVSNAITQYDHEVYKAYTAKLKELYRVVLAHGLHGQPGARSPMTDALDNGYIPVVSTVALGDDAEVSYNVNADTAAAKLATALGAERLLLLTDVRGLLRDPKDESTLIPELQLSSVPALIREGVISGGMIPKIDCCVEAVRSGVKSAIILDGRVAHSILIELLSDEGIGTMLTN